MDNEVSPVLSAALKHNLIQRLPPTFRPYFNQEIRRWNIKFPYERSYLERVVGYVDGLSSRDFEALFHGVREVESKMNLDPRAFSSEEQTIEGSAVLARSPHYLLWRQEVNKVFSRIHEISLKEDQDRMARVNRLLLQIFPEKLPLDPHDLVSEWPDAKLKRLYLNGAKPRSFLEMVLKGPRPPGFLEVFAARKERVLGDVWLVESGMALRELMPGLDSAIRLSFERLESFREGFVDQIKSMRKTLADADAIMRRLQTLDVASWCPREIANTPVIQEFVRSLFLTNNGSQLFANAFVEWGVAQAAAHARPIVVIAEYGLRFKPKPFTSVAIFEDPAQVNPLPSESDPEGSAIDAGILAYYTWLGVRRFPECRRTLCLCLFENAPYILIAGTEDCPLWNEPEPIAPEQLSSFLYSWLS